MFPEFFFLGSPQREVFPPSYPRVRAFVRCLVNIVLASLVTFGVFGSLFCAFNVVFN